ncbi:glutathione S-transferase family protein [Pseudomonas knackmussii]|uniref:glutathione S-transferase family protein n=1 Tax=Pseudomonas knackmussii TaxID=65741 RepID=UPI003F4A04AD
MQLIGMLDSPYVRRVAISLRLLDIDFSHRSLSVFRHYEEFRAINPVVKAPTLVLDDGQVLMDSSLMIELLEHQAGRSLMPAEPAERVRATRLLGLALAACEKAVQMYYELQRAEGRRDPDWFARVDQQLRAACTGLELELLTQPLPRDGRIDQAGLSIAVAWRFIQLVHAERIAAGDYLGLAKWSAYAETLEAFKAFPPV